MSNNTGLYSEQFEHDACGIGFVANLKGNKSHNTVSDALTILENLGHRGACGCENNTGDGAGILLQIPHEFVFEECLKLGVSLPAFGKYGTGIIFFPKEVALREECRNVLYRVADKTGLEILGFRKLPVNSNGIGEAALSVEPEMEQIFIACPLSINNPDVFERKLYVFRNYATKLINSTVRKDTVGFYIALAFAQNYYLQRSAYQFTATKLFP
jgi:glutamate synthase (NADPH/NADH) large chain